MSTSRSGRPSHNDAIWRSAGGRPSDSASLFFLGLGLATGTCVTTIAAGWLFSTFLYRRYSFDSTKQEESSWRIRFIDFVAEIVSDILEHPSVDAALSHTIARGVNRWMISQDAQQAIQALVLQAPREQAVRELGKEVPGYVLNFAGGFVDAITGKGGNSTSLPNEKANMVPNNGDEDPSRNDSWTDLTN